MQLTDWLLVVVALLFIGLTQIFLTKSGFNPPVSYGITSLAAASIGRYYLAFVTQSPNL
jgi:hypothetical protein